MPRKTIQMSHLGILIHIKTFFLQMRQMTTWCPITHVYAVIQKNILCDKFVIFIKANYNNYIPDISEVLSHVQPKRKYTKYICKQCHTILKSGKSPFDGDSSRCNDMCEYEKCAEHNLSIHDYTCTCCHVVSNKRHLFIKFKE